MKIAMVTGGQPRFRNAWITNITSLPSDNEIHLYMYLWKDYGKAKKFDNDEKEITENNVERLIVKNLPNNCLLKKFIQCEMPKYEDLVPEDIDSFPRANGSVPSGKNYIERLYMQHYSLHKAFCLIDEEYDCVIRYRLDGNTEYKIDLNKFNLEEGIYIPDSMKFSEYRSVCPEINDQYAIGSMKTMKVYFDLYNKLSQYIREDSKCFHFETILSYHMVKNSINVKSAEFQYRLER